VELDEILGYHLERAHRLRASLGLPGQDGTALASRAAERLQRAGYRALARGDMRASANLLRRAADLLPEGDTARLAILPDLATALVEAGELSEAGSILTDAIALAQARGDERLEWRARVGRAFVAVWSGIDFHITLSEVAEPATEVLARLGDELGLARAWTLVGMLRFWAGETAAGEAAWQQAVQHARAAQAPREEAQALSWLLIGAWHGPTPVDEGLARCREILAGSPSRQVEAFAVLEQGPLLAMLGRFDEARDLYRQGKEALDELGLEIHAAGASQEYNDIALLAGDPAAAEAELRRACETLERLGEKGFLSTRAALLAHALCALGRDDEAEHFSELAAETGAADDLGTQPLWRSARARVLAARDEFDEAIALAREAVAMVEPTDWLNTRGDLLLALAEVARRAGATEEAPRATDEAARLYEQKGNVVAARKARALLAEARAS
jgi:tetratricopeptide (TPR) repeat protein